MKIDRSELPAVPCRTLSWCGKEYPIISELTGGYSLIAHPNGPAICNGDLLSTIDSYGDDSEACTELKLEAQLKYRKWIKSGCAEMLIQHCSTYLPEMVVIRKDWMYEAQRFHVP